MTTPTPSDYWINECIKIAASAGNLDAAENARRDLAAAQEALRYIVALMDEARPGMDQGAPAEATARKFVEAFKEAQEALKNHLHLDNHNAIVRQLQERAQCAANPKDAP